MWSMYFPFIFFSFDQKAKIFCVQEKHMRKGKKIQINSNLNFTYKENLIVFINFP